MSVQTVSSVSVENIKENPWNPNVMDHDTLQVLKVNLQEGKYDPLVVSPARIFFGDEEQDAAYYIVVDGEQRLTAAKSLGIAELKVIVKDMTDSEAREECYSRGKVRGQLNPIKEGQLFDLELEELGSEAAVAKKYKVSRSYVAGRRTLLRAPEVILDLFKTPEKAYKKVVTKAHAAETREAKKLVKEVQREEDVQPWAIHNARNRIPDPLEEEDIVPRGTLTVSHIEALTALPEGEAIVLATEVMERELSVRETERRAKNRKEELEKEERFRKTLEGAESPTCPECGSIPCEFGYTETVFKCAENPYSDSQWDYTKTPEEHQRKKERETSKQKAERSAQLSEARLNPAYIRRAEDHKELFESMRPWVSRKVGEIETVTRVSITGLRADGKVVRIEYPTNFGSKLSFMMGEPNEDNDLHWGNKTSFYFDIEKKEYKKLPFNSKLDTKATPENRTLVHHFLDHIIQGDGDPVLPEDPEEVKALMMKYGELPQ